MPWKLSEMRWILTALEKMRYERRQKALDGYIAEHARTLGGDPDKVTAQTRLALEKAIYGDILEKPE